LVDYFDSTKIIRNYIQFTTNYVPS